MCNKMGLNAHNTATRHTDQKESVDKSKDSIETKYRQGDKVVGKKR